VGSNREAVVAEHAWGARNPISIFGVWLTTLAAFAFIAFYTIDAFGLLALSPYAGIFGFLCLPAVFVIGLLLIPIGIWREDRRRRQGLAPWVWPVLNLRANRTRQVVFGVLLLTLVNLTIVTVAGFGVVHYSESTQFCGQVCHTPMRPEFVGHSSPPHANVACVECHVSPGAQGFMKAKLNGTRQLWDVIVGVYDHPIPSPARGLPMAADTCAHCHTPGQPARDVIRASTSYADDATNTASVQTLMMHVGTIHWHARSDVRIEYVTTDPKRETIPYVRVTDEKGSVAEYFAEGVSAAPAGERRQMDCLDCHSRPAHAFSASADKAVNEALAAGTVNLTLPFLHREMVAALTPTYPTAAAAHAGIATHLSDFYHRSDGDVAQAIATTTRLYDQNVFPEMHVTWGTYGSEISHIDPPGCFRCHDDTHKTRDGRAIRQDCALCHSIQ
jgi:hypothetical protein